MKDYFKFGDIISFMIKAVIFDLGGVIVSSEVEKIKNIIAKYLGVEENEFDEFLAKYQSDLTKGNISLTDVYKDAIKHFHLQRLSPQSVVNEHLKIFQKILENLNDNVLDLVTKLKKHYKVVCLVNAESDVVPLVQKRGVYGYFMHAYISTELGMEKPDPKIYMTVLKDLGCKPEESVFIDDKKPNVETAKKLGIHGIWYKNNDELIKQFNNLKLIF